MSQQTADLPPVGVASATRRTRVRGLAWRGPARVTLLCIALAIVIHGLSGSQLAPKNLATVLVWVHYRGLLVLTLLFAGNFFCASCPLMLVRDWARRLHLPTRSWPNSLKNKWLA